jgi:hypothetical protein
MLARDVRRGIYAVQQLVHPGAADAAPDEAQLAGPCVPERGQVADPAPLQACCHWRPNAGDIAQVEVKNGARQLLDRKDDEAVGLLHVGRHLSKQLVRRNADRACQAFADLSLDLALDAPPQPFRHGRVLLHPIETARNFVDRHHLLNRYVPIDRRRYFASRRGIGPAGY